MAETLYASASSSGTCSTPANATGTADGTYTTDIDNTSWTHVWDLDNPVGTLAGTDVVDITIRARHQDGTGNPTIDSVRILESGTERGANATGWTITSASQQDVTLTVSVSGMTNWNNAQIEIATTAVGGSPSVRSAVQVDYMSVVVQNATTDRRARVSFAELETGDAPWGGPSILGTVSTFSSTNEFSASGAHTLSAGSNRRVFIVVATDEAGVTGYTVSALYGGVSATLVSDGTNNASATVTATNQTRIDVFEVKEADLPANGGKVVSASTSTTVDAIHAFVVCVQNTDQGTNVQAVATDTTDSGTTINNLSITTTQANSFILEGQALSTDSGDGTAGGTGQVEIADLSTSGVAGVLGSRVHKATTGSWTTSWTLGTSQGRVAGVAIALTYSAGTTDRRARVSWTELELPDAPRRARVSFAELEVPTAPRRVRVSWAELELPTAPRRARVSFAEMEVGDAPRRAQVSFAELEVPSGPRRVRVSWAELELPDGARRAQVSFAELEIPTAPRRVRVSWAEVELPDAPRRAQVSFAELEIADPPRRVRVSFAEFEVPTAPRRVRVSWAELEVPLAPRRAQVSFAELEVPSLGGRALRVSWAELEAPNAARRVRVSFAELETPSGPRRVRVSFAELEVDNAPRRSRVSWAELEVPTAPRRAQVSFAELEVPSGPRRVRVSFAELEVPTAPRRARISWAEVELPDGARRVRVSWSELEVGNADRRARVSWTELEVPNDPGAPLLDADMQLLLGVGYFIQ